MNQETCYLMKKTGQYVKVWTVDDELKLCLVELTRPAISETVTIRQRPSAGGEIEMAFVFPHSTEHYSPKVEGNSMKLVKPDSSSELPDSHWFKKIDDRGGDIYRLKSVISPGPYICIKKYKRSFTLGLCLTESQSVRVTHKAAN